MAKNIEMNYKTQNGYEVLYPETGNWSKEQILSSDTANNLGIGSNGTPDQAFQKMLYTGVQNKVLINSFVSEYGQNIQIALDSQCILHMMEIEIINNQVSRGSGMQFNFNQLYEGYYKIHSYSEQDQYAQSTTDISFVVNMVGSTAKMYLGLWGDFSSSEILSDKITAFRGTLVVPGFAVYFRGEVDDQYDTSILTIKPSITIPQAGIKVNVYKYN